MMRAWLGWILACGGLLVGCGGSEFETSDRPDASSGGGSTGGAAGSSGTAGAAAGGAGSGGTAGAGGTGVGGSGGTAGSGGMAGSGGAPECPTQCLPLPPLGWSGPAELRAAPPEEPVSCSGHYAKEVGSGIEGPFAPPAECGCGCDADYSEVFVLFYSEASCGGTPCGSYVLAEDTCTTPPNGCAGVFGRLEAEPPPDACTGAVTEYLPPAGFEAHVLLCESEDSPDLNGCEPDHFCVVPAGEAICVWRGGDHPDCPVGFPERRLIHHDFEDNRGCGECACATSGKVGQLTQFGGNNCELAPVPKEVPTGCIGASTAATGVSLSYSMYASAPDRCGVSQPSEPFGGIVPVEPLTICCR